MVLCRPDVHSSESAETTESALGSVGDSPSSLGDKNDPNGPFTDNRSESEGQLLLHEHEVCFVSGQRSTAMLRRRNQVSKNDAVVSLTDS